jgi:hypothetical protein
MIVLLRKKEEREVNCFRGRTLRHLLHFLLLLLSAVVSAAVLLLLQLLLHLLLLRRFDRASLYLRFATLPAPDQPAADVEQN